MTTIKLLAVVFTLCIAVIAALVARKAHLPGRIKKAEEFLESDDIQKASEIVKKILNKKQDYVPARYLRARILIKQKQYLLAISELNGVLGINDFANFVNEIDIHYHLADLYHDTQQWQKEVEEYRAILKFNPDDVRANHRIGHVLYRQKHYGDARDHLLKAYTQDPSLGDCLLPLGVSCFHSADHSNAEQYLLKSLETSSDTAEAQYYLGAIYKSRKDYETAIRMYTAVRKDRRFMLGSTRALGEIYFEQEMYDEAIERLEEGLTGLSGKDDDSLAYRYLLAECYERANKITEAVYHWQKIYEVNSSYRSTKTKLEDYRGILDNENQRVLFTASLEELQPLITEVIARLNYNIISKSQVNVSEYFYKAFNIKRINEPPLAIYFNRTTRDITEAQINDFYQRMNAENCKSGIYLTTAKFSIRAKNAAASMMVELMDATFLNKAVERVMMKRSKS
ncbi:MAG: tetratricopeptide repeat protein [Spirochaetes bacterium]|jgi:tetratricopeptide (TPR) repeat protein|nr:tetratricopeptide repeat protein [Spirochaetota bacterium]